MTTLYDSLVRLGLQPGSDFKYDDQDDILIRVNPKGIRRLVKRRYWVNQRQLHVSMLPDASGVVDTALVSVATDKKAPGFWYVILDAIGRPVAEHPLTYSAREFDPEPVEPGNDSDQPPSLQADLSADIKTTGDLTRLLVSWMTYYDQINDEESAAVLEILSIHNESPREAILHIKSQNLAQRLHDEVICFLDDVSDDDLVGEQANKLRERLALLLKAYPV